MYTLFNYMHDIAYCYKGTFFSHLFFRASCRL